jgi:hypothetical protein
MAGQCKSINLAVGKRRVNAIQQVISPVCWVSEEAPSAMVCSFGMTLPKHHPVCSRLHGPSLYGNIYRIRQCGVMQDGATFAGACLVTFYASFEWPLSAFEESNSGKSKI